MHKELNNHYVGALATLGPQVINQQKRCYSSLFFLRKYFEELSLDREDWRTPLKAKLVSPKGVADLKEFKDHILIP